MLDRAPSAGSLPPLIYPPSIKRWRSGAAPRSYRRDLGVAASQYRRTKARLVGPVAPQYGRLWSGLPLLLLALTGCATQGPYQSPRLEAPAAWTLPAAEAAMATPAEDGWWRQLNDPAIDVLVEAALTDSPTVAQAVARVDEARAVLGVAAAQRTPSVAISGSATRARSLDADSPSGGTRLSSQSTAGLGLSWEIDLFGRVRNSIEAGGLRVAARNADAKAASLALTSEISDLVLASRACELSITVLREEIGSREQTLALTRLRLDTGFVAPIEESRAQSGVAAARTALATRAEECARIVNALVAASGQSRVSVQALVCVDAGAAGAPRAVLDVVAALPEPPPVQLTLPATTLAAHPLVMAAEREVAAAWSDIAVARAERLPRLDLGAALSGQWLRAAGQTFSETVWSLGPALSGPIFDGGRAASNVSAAEARYRIAVANLRIAVRTAAQDVENAMAAIVSATQRRRTTLDAVAAAQRVLDATQARWNAGAVSLFEVEDARRQLAAAHESAIAAAHDSSRAWIALVRASGHATASNAGGVLA